MSRKGIRQCKVHQRIHILRRRYDRSVLLGMTGMIVVLAACMGVLLRETHSSGIPMVSAGYGSVLLRNGADRYVIIGMVAFTAGVLFTMCCIWIRNNKAQKNRESDTGKEKG